MHRWVALGGAAAMLMACGTAEDRVTEPVVSAVEVRVAEAHAGAASAGRGNYDAQLSGEQEIPPVDTRARGVATFRLTPDGEGLEYVLNVSNLTAVRFAHLHWQPTLAFPERQNGPVVVTLFDVPEQPGATAPAVTGDQNGRLVSGVIRASDLAGVLAGQPLSSLVEQINAGRIYVNVHTNAHPGGEVRGDVRTGLDR